MCCVYAYLTIVISSWWIDPLVICDDDLCPFWLLTTFSLMPTMSDMSIDTPTHFFVIVVVLLLANNPVEEKDKQMAEFHLLRPLR